MHASNQAPKLPQIVDEAADTPWWLPVVGAALLALMALVMVAHRAHGTPAETTAGAEAAAPPPAD